MGLHPQRFLLTRTGAISGFADAKPCGSQDKSDQLAGQIEEEIWKYFGGKDDPVRPKLLALKPKP
jgi:hypothetical protein